MTPKKQIVFVNQSSGYLMIDIVNEFKEDYEERVLITGLLNPRNINLDANVKIEKTVPYRRTSFIKRIVSWSLAFLKAVWLIKTKYRKADLFLVSNPPFTTFIPLFCSNPYKLLIYDIYPDALVEFNYLKEVSLVTKFWKKVNKKVFTNAQMVYTLTEGMKSRIIAYTEDKNIKIIPIWTDNDFLKPINKAENNFLQNHQISDKFIIMYSGNMGKAHPVEILVELAIKFKTDSNLFFLLIGGGDKYKEMDTLIKQNQLVNVMLLPWQDTRLLPYTLSGADLALVTVGSEASDLSIPSKTYNLMSAGTPIICVAPKNAALSQLVESEKIGFVFQEDEINNIGIFIDNCRNQKLMYKELITNNLNLSLKYTSKNAALFRD